MINKSVDESIFEAVLAQAFLEASEKDMEHIFKEEQKTPEYPEKFQKTERKKYDKICRETYTTPYWVTSLKRAASFILIIGFTCSIIMFSAPTIRAEFFNLTTEFFEKYFSISLANKTSGYETSDYIFKYIPDYLVDIEVDENPVSSVYTFTSVDGEEYVSINIYQGHFDTAQYDNEHIFIEDISINGYSGYILKSTIEDTCEILWTDNVFLVSVYGNISVEELLKISENIVEKSQ